jgi:hypothetical protein
VGDRDYFSGDRRIGMWSCRFNYQYRNILLINCSDKEQTERRRYDSQI